MFSAAGLEFDFIARPLPSIVDEAGEDPSRTPHRCLASAAGIGLYARPQTQVTLCGIVAFSRARRAVLYWVFEAKLGLRAATHSRLFTPPRIDGERESGRGRQIVTENRHPSISSLHKQWAKLEDEHNELAIAIDAAADRPADLTPMRERQAKLLLEIAALVAQIQDTPARTTEDFLALLDVALEHEVDLASDLAFYGAADFPIITRLLDVLARIAPSFEFNSLKRWSATAERLTRLAETPNG